MRRLAQVSVLLAMFAAPYATSAGDGAGRLQLDIEAPEAGARIGLPGRAFVTGRALAHAARGGRFDVMIVIDRSASTSGPSRADVDGDGKTGKRWGSPWLWFLPRLLLLPNTDPGDSILASEVAAAATLLDQLEPSTSRVGIVAFAGDPTGRRRDAWLEVPLTSHYDKVRHALARLLEEGPRGQTNILAALQLAAIELSGGYAAASTPRPDARKIVLFMTDGQPTLPVRGRRMENARLAVALSRDLGMRGLRVDTFAIGDSAADDPYVPEGVARETGGVFTPVRDPRELMALFRGVNLAEVRELRVRNVTTGSAASYTALDADGHFSALVPLADGWNDLSVEVAASDGTRARRTVSVYGLPGASTQRLSSRLHARRRRLLETRLAELRQRGLELAVERAEAERRSLEIEIESARASREADGPRAERALQITTDD